MDSRRQRKWRRANLSEITRVVNWINAPDYYVSAGPPNGEGIIEMELECIAAFGQKSLMPKKYWRDFLIKKGVSPEKFRNSSGQTGP